MQFAAYGGFLLLDPHGKVVAAQAISMNAEATGRLAFGPPREWRDAFTEPLKAAGRFQPITLPNLKKAGATHFCWINPGEVFSSEGEKWEPAAHGAFLYLQTNKPPTYFQALPAKSTTLPLRPRYSAALPRPSEIQQI